MTWKARHRARAALALFTPTPTPGPLHVPGGLGALLPPVFQVLIQKSPQWAFPAPL